MKIKLKNGGYVETTYEELCKELGFIPSIHFITVKNGKISFSVGKKEEVLSLYKAVKEHGYVADKGLLDTLRAEDYYFRP